MLRDKANSILGFVRTEYSNMQFVSALAGASAGMTISMRVTVELHSPFDRAARRSALSKQRMLKLRSRRLKVRAAAPENQSYSPACLTELPGPRREAFHRVAGSRRELVLPSVLAKRSRSQGARVPEWEPSFSPRPNGI